jgi:predicted permease
MSSGSRFLSLLRNLFRKDRVERELDEELRAYEALLSDEKRSAGLDEASARRAARVEIEGLEQLKERVRDVRTGVLLEQLGRDLAYGARVLRRSPGFTGVALLSLALGIGANTALFSVMDALFWRPLPVREPERLVRFGLSDTLTREERARVGYLPAFPLAPDDLAQASDVFAGVITTTRDGVSLSYEGVTRRVMADAVSGNYFAVLGVKAFLGRGFSEEVVNGGWTPEVVLTHRFWRGHFGADPGVIGKTVLLNGYAFGIVGVAPEGFYGTQVGDYYEVRVPMLPPSLGEALPAMPLLRPSGVPGRVVLTRSEMMARLADGVSIARAEQAGEALLRNAIQQKFGDDPRFRAIRLRLLPGERGGSELRGAFERPLQVLMATVGVVLLIACANLASLLIGRAAARRREIAVRLAIGAGRSRLVRQLLTESLLLSALGGSIGVLFAWWGADVLFGFVPQDHLPRALEVKPDGRALGFTLGLTALTALFFGLAPALQATRVDLLGALKGGAPAGQAPRSRARRALVVAEVALCLLLLVGATLLVRSLRNYQAVEPGFEQDGVVLFTMKHVHERYTPEQLRIFCRDLVEEVRRLPGVRAAGLAETGPFSGRVGSREVAAPALPSAGAIPAVVDRVSPGFLDSLGIRLLAGRDFAFTDREGAPLVAIVDEGLARRLFSRAGALGERIRIDMGGRTPDVKDFEVIGVAGSIRYRNLREDRGDAVYLSLLQGARPWMPTLHVRGDGPASPGVAAVRGVFQALDKDLPVFNVKTMSQRLDESLAQNRLVAQLSSFFGALAALLAAIGLYGVMAHAVASRTREIGIRMALGARPFRVLRLVMGDALLLVSLGVVLGLAAAFATTRWISSQLFGLRPLDPAALSLAVALMLLVAAAASAVPARVACRVDPARALRQE